MNKKTYLCLLSAFIFISTFFIARTASASVSDCKDIQTAYGKVSGVLDPKTSTCSYKGIPYAAPPVGDLRWAAPKEPAPWKDTLAADKFRDICIQEPFSLTGSSGKYEGGEDCLYLNVWHPASAPAKPRAVILFIHGGSNMMGAGSWDLYDGSNMTSRGDVILVTFNYRLGPFGMLSDPMFKDKDGNLGNWLMLDQLAAMRWVKNNIAAFGGDPGNVTIMGESAGGMSVAAFLLVKEARGLFGKAIIESGPPIFLGAPLETQSKVVLDVAAKLGCSGDKIADCLRKADSKSVMEAFKPAMTAHGGTVEVYDLNLSMDERFIFSDPFKKFADGDFNKDVRIIVGSNHDEAGLYALQKSFGSWAELEKTVQDDTGYAASYLNLVLNPDEVMARYPKENYKAVRKAYIDIFTDMIYACPAVVQAQQLADNGATVFEYQFQKSPDEKEMLGDIGVFHAAELPFVFGNFNFMGFNIASKKNSAVSKMMMELWTSFARTGTPSAEGVPAWPPHTPSNPAFLGIGLKPEVGSGLKADICAFYAAAYKNAHPH